MTVRLYTGGASVQVIDEAPVLKQPAIVGFAATPGVVTIGQSVTLSGTVTDAVSITLNGVTIPGLPQVFAPTSTQTYTLVVTGAAGTTPATASLDVIVNAAPSVPGQTFAAIAQTPLDVNNMAHVDYAFNGEAAPGGPPGGRPYERFQRHLVLTTDVTRLHFNGLGAQGAWKVLEASRYGVFISAKADMSNPMLRAAVNVAAGKKDFFADIALQPADVDAPYFMQVRPVSASDTVIASAGETYPVFGFWIDRNGQAKNHPAIIVQNGSFSWVKAPASVIPASSDRCLILKTDYVDTPRPLPLRETVTKTSATVPKANLARVPLVLSTDAGDQDRHHRTITNRGIIVTECIQGYRPNEMFDDIPTMPLYDGPRGVCTAPYTTALKPGRNGKVYPASPWSLAVMDSPGLKRTLIGLRHKPGLAPYYAHAPTSVTDPMFAQCCEIVGDWDVSIPLSERWPLESWFFIWDKRSLELDLTAPLIGGEPPHKPYTLPSGEVIDGPRGFMGDRRGWVLDIRFSGSNRNAPAKVRKWITGLLGPWGGDNMPGDNTFALAERIAHRVAEWSMDVPNTKVRDLKFSPAASAAGTVGMHNGGIKWNGDHVAARTFDICGPESVRVMDNKLSIGSLAQEEVREWDLDALSAPHVVIAKPTFNYTSVGSYFLDHSKSDGTFYPRHTCFTTTFFNSTFGNPQCFLPGGVAYDWISYYYGIDRGRGGPNAGGLAGAFLGGNYPTAVGGPFEGRLWTADAAGGVQYFCVADAYDPPTSQADYLSIERGYYDWRKNGLSMHHGPYGIHQSRLSLRKGENVDRDAWIARLGL